MDDDVLELDAVPNDEGTVPPVRANFDDEGNLFIFQEAGEVLIDREHVTCFADWLMNATCRDSETVTVDKISYEWRQRPDGARTNQYG